MAFNGALNANFPIILLGPILRRAEAKQVCIWVACSLPVIVKAEVFKFSELGPSRKSTESIRPSPIGFGVTKSLRLGEHLHIALVTARPIGHEQNKDSTAPSGFPSDTLLSYDIEIIEGNNARNKGQKLADLGLTSGRNTIAYEISLDGEHGMDFLPTFFLCGKDGQFNLMHGSCRKLHGKGEDCLVAADELISSSPTDLSKRPSALFLTGDQIYADDVARPLSRYLTEFGIKLLGWEERIRGVNTGLSKIMPGERQEVIREFANFTAGHARNHLLGFGEFAAMYMLAWNEENWPDALDTGTEISFGERTRYTGQIKQLKQTRRDLAAVRRVLANIPTYMIFDDHEITDDWNITREWHDNVADSQCGKQIVTNGLAAYWAFQGWGNDPAMFSDAFIDRIVEHFGKQSDIPNDEMEAFEDFLWNYHGWTFSAPTNPLTILVDSRTQRHYDTFKGAPQIVGEEGLLSIARTAEDANFKKGEAIILVVPTPVIGFYLIEALQKAIALMTSIYALDLESWFANSAGRIRFLTFLLRTLAPKHCIFLSGDVHFGFTNKAAYAPLQEGYGYDDVMSITQLNSSALKTTSLVKIAFVSEILGRIRQMFPFKRLVRTGRLSYIRSLAGPRHPDWVEARTIVHTTGSIFTPLIISDNNLGLVTIDRSMCRIIHKLLVRKANGVVKIHEAIVTTKNGRSPLEESVRAQISKFNLK